MSKKDWTDQLPELFEGYAEAEPEGLWEAVQGAMAPKRRKAAAAWWWYGAAALAAAACVAVGVFLFRSDPADFRTDVPNDNLAVLPTDVSPVITEDAPTVISDNTPSVSPSDPSSVIPSNSSSVIPSDPSSVIPSASEESTHADARSESGMTVEKEETVEEAVGEGQKEEKAETVGSGQKEEKAETAEKAETDFWDEPESDRKKPRKPVEIKVRAGLSSGQYLAQDVTRTTTGYGLPVSYPGMPMSKAAQSNSGLSPMMLSRNKPSITDAQHHRSSRFGITLGASFGRHWGMESGIYLTTLRSTYASESGAARSTTEREMRYIGFPLHLQYRIWWYGKFSVYGVAGPMFETAYRTRTTTVQTLGGHQEHKTDRTRISDNRWSVQAGAGAQLEFLPGASLFLQPSLSWHIPNGNGLENAYSEHPFSPEFFFGVRFTFDR